MRKLSPPPTHTHLHAQVGTHGMFRARDAVSPTGELEWRPFHHTLEDLYGAPAAYYALPTLSFRRAPWPCVQFRRMRSRGRMQAGFAQR